MRTIRHLLNRRQISKLVLQQERNKSLFKRNQITSVYYDSEEKSVKFEHQYQRHDGLEDQSLSDRAKNTLIKMFFPRDYPHSVTSNYLKYSQWSFMGSVCGTMSGVLSTQALLQALGMGTGSSMAISATLNWVIKDGLGLLGGVLYTSFASGRFDSEPKRYRFKSAVVLQVIVVIVFLTIIQLSMLCELLTPLVPQLFLPLASISNIGKNISWLVLSGTRAQMHQSFCTRDNLGDVTAKSGSQATAAALIGTGLGILSSAAFGTALTTSLCFYFPLGFLNLYSIYKSNYVVQTKSLNIQRAEMIIYDYITKDQSKDKVLTPQQLARKEDFIIKYQSIFGKSIQINSNIDVLNAEDVKSVQNQVITSKYAVINKDKTCYLWIEQSAQQKDVLKGFYSSCIQRTPRQVVTDVDDFEKFYQKIKRSNWNLDDLNFEEKPRIKLIQKQQIQQKQQIHLTSKSPYL